MKIESFEQLYKFLYNKLVDISCSNTWKIGYLIGPKYEVCNYDTVQIAKDLLVFCKNKLSEFKKFNSDNYYETKCNEIIKSLIIISNAKRHSFENGLFDIEYYYFASDTVDIAKKSIEKMEKYI